MVTEAHGIYYESIWLYLNMKYNSQQMELVSALVRLEALKLWKRNHGPLSGTLSIIDVYVVLFFQVFTAPYWKGQKRLARVIPKSTSAFAFYATLKHAGLFDEEVNKHLPPVVRKDRWVGGVSSTLTKNLDQAVGMALVSKFRNDNYPVIVGISEGDLQAGVSQQAKIASSWGLNNLAVILDCNQIQSSYTVNNADPTVIPDKQGKFPRLKKIWEGYGWDYREVDGHNYKKLEQTLRLIGDMKKPLIIVARTVKGKGISFIEKDPIRYIHKMSEDEYVQAIQHLERKVTLMQRKTGPLKITPIYYHKHINTGKPLILPKLRKNYDEDTTEQVFKDWMSDFSDRNKSRVFIVDTDNPYPFPLSVKTYSSKNKSPHISVGVNERMAVNIARGIANSGCFPIFGSPATHIQIAAEDFMRCAIDRDPVLLVSFRSGSDLGHWGFTHNSNNDCLLFSFPDSFIFQAATNDDVQLIFNAIYSNPSKYLPAYFRLPTRVFKPREKGFISSNMTTAFQDGFYYLSTEGNKSEKRQVLFIASGTILRECADAIITLEKIGVSCLFINVLNLTEIGNQKLFNKLVQEASVIVSVIDANPLSLSGLIFKTIPKQDRKKVIIMGLNDFGRGIYSRDEVLKHNKLDAESLIDTVNNSLAANFKHYEK